MIIIIRETGTSLVIKTRAYKEDRRGVNLCRKVLISPPLSGVSAVTHFSRVISQKSLSVLYAHIIYT